MKRLIAFAAVLVVFLSAGCGKTGTSGALPPAQAGVQGQVRHVNGAPASFGIVQTTTNYNSTAPTVTMTWGTRPVSGHLMIAVVRWNNSPSGSSVTAAGWTQLDATSSQAVNGFVLYKVAGSSEPTSVTFTCSTTSGYPTANGMEISGASTTAPFNGHRITGTSPGASYTSPSLTPTLNGTLPIVIVDTGQSTQTPQTPSGWTKRFSEATGVTAAYEANAVTTGTSSAVSATIAATGSSAYSSFIWEGLVNAAQPVPGSIVQSSTNSSTSPPNVSLTWSQTPKAGDLLIAVVRWNAPGTASSSGWTTLDTITTQDVDGYILYRIAGASEPRTVTFTMSTSSGYPLVTGMEVAGVSTTAPFNRHQIAANSPASSYTSPSLTPTVDGTLPIAVFDIGDQTGGSLTGSSGWSNVYTDPQGVTAAFVNPVTSSSLTPISETATLSGRLSAYSSFSWLALLNPPSSTGCTGLNNQSSFPASCQFYTATSPWRTPVAASPSYMSNSAAIIAHMLNGRNGAAQITTTKVNNPNDGSQDYAMPYYVGTASDPALTIHCTASWGCGALEGTVVHIPANAKSEQGGYPNGDQHLIVLDVSGSSPVEFDFWGDHAPRPFVNGTTYTVGSGVKGDPYNGNGFGSSDITGATATAAGNLSLGALVRITELQAGLSGIGHALTMQSACSSGAHVAPARADGGLVACADGDNTNTPPMGAHYWWDESCATIAARTTIGAGAKALLCALHTYGGFEADTNGNDSGLGISDTPESATRYISLGNPDLVTSYMVSNAPNTGYPCPTGHACYQFDLVNLSVSDVEAHLHILAP